MTFSNSPRPEPTSRFLRACHRLPVDRTPIWLMRQAGRYMPEYRALRARYSMLEMVRSPELAAEVTLQPLRAFDLDAAIIFSDILPPLIGMGLPLDYVKGEGPHIERPIRSTRDVDLLATPPAAESMAGTLGAIRIVARELGARNIPLIGFAGAPFTLAAYAIEGGGSKTYERVRAFMASEPAAWKRLMEKLVTVQADYLVEQARAGADALQLFDSWAGVLSRQEYVRYIQPYNTALLRAVARAGVPRIHFSTRTAAYIEEVAACGGEVIGVDSQLPLDTLWARIGDGFAIQGNLDPVTLLAPWREQQYRIDDLLRRAGSRPGHIFNLGHGITPSIQPDAVRRLVEYVHEQSERIPAPEGA